MGQPSFQNVQFRSFRIHVGNSKIGSFSETSNLKLPTFFAYTLIKKTLNSNKRHFILSKHPIVESPKRHPKAGDTQRYCTYIYWRYTLKFVLHLYMRIWLRTQLFKNLLAVTYNLGVWQELGSLLQYHWCSKCMGPQLGTSSFWKFLSTTYLQGQQSWSFKNSCSPLIVFII